MKIKKILHLLLLFTTITLLISCSKGKEEIIPSVEREVSKASSAVEVDKLMEFLSTTIPIHRDSVVYSQKDSLFIIMGDIVTTRKDVERRFHAGKNGRKQHWRGNYLVRPEYAGWIRVYLGSPSDTWSAQIPEEWKVAIRDAMRAWNTLHTIHGVGVKFVEVPYHLYVPSYDISVGLYYENSDIVARAHLPTSDGKPGGGIYINTKYNGTDSGSKHSIMVHELGHTIGFLHTHETKGVFINGTLEVDRYSIMGYDSYKKITAGDIQAAQILYPGSLPKGFQKQQGLGRDIGGGPCSSCNTFVNLIGVDTQPGGYGIYSGKGDSWTKINGGGIRIDRDMDGYPWIINSSNQILKRYVSSWQTLTGAGIDIGIGGNNTVCIVGTDNGVYKWVKNNSNWTKMESSAVGSAIRISVDPVGNPWIINSSNDVYRYEGTTWRRVGSVKARDIGVGSDGTVYVVGTDSSIRLWSGVYQDGWGWIQIPGQAMEVDVSSQGFPWIINANNEIFVNPH